MVWLLCLFALVMTGLGTAVFSVSAAANYSFGLTQGTLEPFAVDLVFATVTTSTAHIMALVNLAVDGLKALLPFTAIVCWRFRCYGWSVTAALLFLLCLSWAGTNSIGFMATEAMKAKDSRASGGLSYEVLKSRLEALQTERGMVPLFRPAGTVEAEIDELKRNRLFKRSKGCSEAEAEPGSRSLCHAYGAAVGELAAARRAEQLNGQIDQTRTEMTRERRVSESAPLSAMAASWLNVKASTIEEGRSIKFSLLIELISAFIFTLAWTPVLAWCTQRRAVQRSERDVFHVAQTAPAPAAAPAAEPLEQVKPAAAEPLAKPVVATAEPLAPAAVAAAEPLAGHGKAAAAPSLHRFPVAARAQAPDPRFARRPDPFPITELARRGGAAVSKARLGPRFNSPKAAAAAFVKTLTPGFYMHPAMHNMFKTFCEAHKCKSGHGSQLSKLLEPCGVQKLAYPDGRIIYLVGEAAGTMLKAA